MLSVSSSTMRYIEGGNKAALLLLPIGFGACLVWYTKLAEAVSTYCIDVQSVYSYTFNIFAIELGALLALFALLASRPTEFLERIKNTSAFKQLVANVKLALWCMTICIIANFLLAILKVTPAQVLNVPSILFLLWIAFSLITTVIYGRIVRLIFMALT
jgi:hypothetical protein